VDVAVHPLRCGLAMVPRCQGLSTVRCGGEGLVLHGVWHVLQSAKDLFLGVDPLPPRTTCAATCLVWNGLLNKLVHSETCPGVDYRFKCLTLGIRKVQLGRVKCVHVDHWNVMGMGFKCITP
jgi:hypothetical protein